MLIDLTQQRSRFVIARPKAVAISSTAVPFFKQPINIEKSGYSMLIGASVIHLRCRRFPRGFAPRNDSPGVLCKTEKY